MNGKRNPVITILPLRTRDIEVNCTAYLTLPFYDIYFNQEVISVKIKNIEINKPNRKKINIEFLLLILFLIIIFTAPFIINQKKELPDGTLMSMNRFNKQITVKPPDSNFYYVADPSGSISYRNCETNEEIGYIPPNFNDNLYKTCLPVFKN